MSCATEARAQAARGTANASTSKEREQQRAPAQLRADASSACSQQEFVWQAAVCGVRALTSTPEAPQGEPAAPKKPAANEVFAAKKPGSVAYNRRRRVAGVSRACGVHCVAGVTAAVMSCKCRLTSQRRAQEPSQAFHQRREGPRTCKNAMWAWDDPRGALRGKACKVVCLGAILLPHTDCDAPLTRRARTHTRAPP